MGSFVVVDFTTSQQLLQQSFLHLGKSLCLSSSFDMASAIIVESAIYFQLGMEVLAPVS